MRHVVFRTAWRDAAAEGAVEIVILVQGAGQIDLGDVDDAARLQVA